MHFILDLLNGNVHIYEVFFNTDTETISTVLIAYRDYSFEANHFLYVIIGLYSASVFLLKHHLEQCTTKMGLVKKNLLTIILLHEYYVSSIL